MMSLKPFARSGVTGEIDALLEEAATGRLEDTGDEKTPIRPAHPNPEVFELRLKSLNKALRLYHGEPAHFPDHLIALHMHIKVSSEGQREEIAYTTGRYLDGLPADWGVAT